MNHLITYAGFTRLGLSYDHNEDVVVAEGAYLWSGEFAGSFSGAEMEDGGHLTAWVATAAEKWLARKQRGCCPTMN